MNAQKKTRRRYSDDEKIQIIEDLAAKKMRYSDVLKSGIYSSMLHRWREQYQAGELKRSTNGATSESNALVPSEAAPQSIEVIPARRKYVRRNQVAPPDLSEADGKIRNKEMSYWLDRACRNLVEEIRAHRAGVEQLTSGYTVDMLNAARAGRGGK